MRRFLLGSMSVFLFLLVSGGCAHLRAQSVAVAQIQGVISDPSGAAVPDAEIQATQTDTGLAVKTVSGSGGNYILPNLLVGPYSLVVSAKGFAGYAQSGIILHVGDKVRINVTLKLGTVTQQVNVVANASMVHVDTPSVSGVVSQQRINDLPLNGRQITDLVVLLGAAAPVTAGEGGRFDLAPGSGGIGKQYALETPYSVGGGQANGNNWLLDGADNNDTFVNVAMAYPMPDAVQEFSVQTNAQQARYGLHPGSTVNVVTKSGSNAFHGDLFEFLRNGDLNARNFFAARQDTLKRNQFGGTIGGPIKKDKLFFFGAFQGTRNRTAPPTSISYVPTAAMLTGDFSALESAACQSSGKPRTIIDPTTGSAFPNNYVDPSRFNSSALALLKYVPISSNPCGKIVYSKPSTGDEDQYLGRVDWNISQNNRFLSHFFLTNFRNPTLFDGKNILPTGRTGVVDRDISFVIGDNYSFGPTAFNSFHFAATRLHINRGYIPNYLTDSSIGLDNVYHTNLPCLSLGVSGHFGNGSCSQLLLVNNSFEATDDVDVLRGRNHFAFGGQYFRNQMNEHNLYNQNGSFGFNGNITGDPIVDFLLGDLSSFQQGGVEAQAWRENVVQLYGEDSIHVNSRLGLTLGVRWAPWMPQIDKMGLGAHFDPAAFASGTTSTVYQNSPAGLLYYGDPGIPRAYTNADLLNIEPRLGLSWDPTGKGVESIRASYGIMHDSPMLYYFDRFGVTEPFGATVGLTNPPGGLSNVWAGYPGGNPFPIPYPPTSTVPFPTSATIVSLPLHMPSTYVQQWNLSLERQFAGNWLISASYMGNKTTHLWVGTELNPGVYIPGTCGSGPCSTTGNVNQRRVLYLQNPAQGVYYNTIGQTDTGANAEYNALLLTAKHRFSHDFTILSNYTWSHCISEGDFQGELIGPDYQNPYNRNADRGNCLFDHRNVFNTSFVVASPTFGQQWKRRLLGNWQLSSWFNYTSGTWITPLVGLDNSRTGVGWDRPNVVLSNPLYPSQQSPSKWFNPAAFTPNAIGTYGNAGRDSILGPHAVYLNSALMRSFPVSETKRFEFRFEMFNALNHPNFGLPNTSMKSSQFGQITSAGDPRILQFGLKFYF